MRPARAALLLASLALAPAAQARPVVVELFTSQACASCPPADALLATYAKNPGVLPLSFNVTYWNSPVWSDPDSLKAATARQAWYAGLANSQSVYTPQAIVDGTVQLVGSDATKLAAAIAAAQAAPAGDVPVSVKDGAMVRLVIGMGSGSGNILLLGFDARHITHIGGGENSGAVVTEVNVVRSITSLGPWSGQQMAMSMSRPAGQHMAVLLQANNGAILGAGTN
ncbi:coproporphyrinogen III oxidase [Acidocella aquatica]|uniref:Coproporphyrinogen III oxidase n=1 Tax=Acidocella aquatica TaxID=1922313 RepID=A0ABQ6A8G4_9PROT|nr:DUF1223 domain-containing protein [Acidocella aquatica]GLR68509.1 coproporphyrinogen III oxidase [Acidocella aquatica]